MPNKNVVHHIDIRVKYLLKILHQVLVLLVECVIKNHNGQINKSDFGIGLSEILGSSKLQKFREKISKDPICKDHFFMVNPQTNNLQLKPSIEIGSLDISILTNLLDKIISMSNLSKCCINCNHKCRVVPNNCVNCLNRTNCGLSICPSCQKPSCNLIKILKFCRVVRSLRNCFAHGSEDIYDKLENGQGGLQDFPSTNTWKELWTLIKTETLSCLDVIKINDQSLISNELYEDYQMDLRIAFKKEIHFIAPTVEKDLSHYYKTILGKRETQEQISSIYEAIDTSNSSNKGLI